MLPKGEEFAMTFSSRIPPVIFSLIILGAAIAPVHAQQEFSPPQGKGRAVVVVSGHDGAAAYRGFAAQIAQLGYDAVLFDANNIAGNESAALRVAIQQAQQMPHAIPGKVGLVGFSQGGGQVLIYGSQMSDVASVVIAWYPATRSIGDTADFVGRLKLPVLMLAGEADMQRGCCLIETARALAAAAADRPFELVTYPNTQHAFIYGGSHYNPQAYADAMQRTATKLAQYLGR
jgi:dienelactone hydrolase